LQWGKKKEKGRKKEGLQQKVNCNGCWTNSPHESAQQNSWVVVVGLFCFWERKRLWWPPSKIGLKKLISLLKAPDHNVKFLIQNSNFQIYYVPILTETYIGGCVHWDGWWLAKFGPLKAKKKNLKCKKPKSSGHLIWFLTLDPCVTLDANTLTS